MGVRSNTERENAMKTILLVDDEPEQLRSLKIGLSGKGYKILGVTSGPAALESLENRHSPVHIVITDYFMPEMDGIDLLKHIRKRFRSLPVVLMTAYGQKSLVVEALKNQCDGFIEKPFTSEALIQEIDRIKHLRLHNIDSHDMTRLVPRMMHHVKNPLFAIRGHAELGILGHGDDEALKKRFKSIVDAVDAITTINNQIIQLGRPQEKRMDIKEQVTQLGMPQEERREKFNLVDLLDDCLGLFSGLITLKRVVVEKEFEAASACTVGFKTTLKHAFKNLILNAIEAMDGRPLKRLKVKIQQPEDTSGISICMEDNGCGMSDKTRQRIFEPYFSSKAHGSGLGLAVVREAVKRHQGEITVKSQEGVGTCLVIQLPLDC